MKQPLMKSYVFAHISDLPLNLFQSNSLAEAEVSLAPTPGYP